MRVLNPGDAINLVAACASPTRARGQFNAHPFLKTGNTKDLLTKRTPPGRFCCHVALQKTRRRQTQRLCQTANIDQSDIALSTLHVTQAVFRCLRPIHSDFSEAGTAGVAAQAMTNTILESSSMIGLFFLFVIGLWVLIAVKLGTKIPKLLGTTRYRTAFSVVLVPLIFVAPVADEIIAYPQMMALCKNSKPYELAPGIDEKHASGRTVYYDDKKALLSLWPSTVKVARTDTYYRDATTKEPVLQSSSFHALQGMLGMPAGSSGDKMAILLGGCGSRYEPYDSKGVPTRFSHLNLTKIPSP